jgi:phosphoribosylformylglycinamidine (FGAM) synthase-like enzyme
MQTTAISGRSALVVGLAISQERRLALDLAEMQAIQAYYRAEEREPTDVELEMMAQTWSEHCVHKTFKASSYTGPAGRTGGRTRARTASTACSRPTSARPRSK